MLNEDEEYATNRLELVVIGIVVAIVALCSIGFFLIGMH